MPDARPDVRIKHEAPDKSPLVAELMKLNDPEVRRLVQTLAQAAKKPLEQTPLVEDIVAVEQASAKRKSVAVR